MPNPGGQSGERQRGCGYQQIADGAVDDGEEDLELRAARPDRIEGQLGRFPYEMDSGSRAQVEQNRAPYCMTWLRMWPRPRSRRMRRNLPIRSVAIGAALLALLVATLLAIRDDLTALPEEKSSEAQTIVSE